MDSLQELIYLIPLSGKSPKSTPEKYATAPRTNQSCTPMSNPSTEPYSCPFTPCGMDPPLPQFSVPCEDCGAIFNPPCANQDATMSLGYSQNIMVPCMECGNMPYPPCLPPNGYGQQTSVPCNECAMDKNAPCYQDTENDLTGNYQEIGASMGNNSLTIRVHKDKNKIEAVDEQGNVIEESSCPCRLGRPRMGKDAGQTLAMMPGVRQGNENLPFSFRMGKCGDGEGGGVIVNPPVSLAPDGTQFTEFSDPSKERFVLRIGKKSEGVNKKQNLELELCTPKGPELKPIPKKETRDTQYDEKDCPGDEGGKKGGKGKGTKGKGGKGKGKKKK